MGIGMGGEENIERKMEWEGDERAIQGYRGGTSTATAQS